MQASTIAVTLCFFRDSIGFGWPNPVTLDLSILKVSFGITMELNVAKLLCVIAALAAYLGWGKRL